MSLTKEDIDKLSEKNSFLVQKSMYEDLKLMNASESHYILNAIFEYVISGVIPTLDKQEHRFVKSVFNRFKLAYDNDSSKWLKACKKKSSNKKQEWLKRKTDVSGNPLEHPTYS
ncbi:hypothetical protein JHD47_05655 [Sulfurimonas sp. SAG-AH-194-L11]|nr:DUF6291 domain-containing protein [Sulfurimonas sp. SAG-AH-194-L11]MDF1877297.1 hypothetical protein [Sulfurimonas sp. SAG-AH-194-L11]